MIPAHNEELLLPAALSAIQNACGDVGISYEVIVASDASTDGTVEVAQQAGARVVEVNHRQIAATRNSGAQAALSESLVFVDADTQINAVLLNATLAALRDGAVGGGCRVAFEGEMPRWSAVAISLFNTVYSRWNKLAAGCYVFATRQAFDAVGGFDTKLYASEEITLSRSLHKQGTFVVLQESVTTSARKLRTYSFREILSLVGMYAWRGQKAFEQREGLEVWYGPRRDDPAS